MAYRVWYEFDDGTTEDLLGETFSTEKEARNAALEGINNYNTGVETLQMGGHDYPEANIEDYYIEKI